MIAMLVHQKPLGGGKTLREMRDFMERSGGMFPLPEGLAREEVRIGDLAAEWLTPAEVDPGRTLVYLHGGAYLLGSPGSHRHLAGHLAVACRARVLVPDYRRAPEHRFPAWIEDATVALRWLAGQGIDPARLVVAGDSAGGGLALAAMISLRDSGDPLPAAAVLLSPWTDMTGTGVSRKTKAAEDPMIPPDTFHDTVRAVLGDTPRDHPLASPLFADLAGLPPMLIHVGTREVLLDDATRLAARARQAGVPLELYVGEGLIHVWHYFVPLVPEARASVEAIGGFVRERCP
jgi:acetyl esterase/lipase